MAEELWSGVENGLHLQSDVTPRWVLIGWLLMCTKPGLSDHHAKLALFFDWLFFNPKCVGACSLPPSVHFLFACGRIQRPRKRCDEICRFRDAVHPDLDRC